MYGYIKGHIGKGHVTKCVCHVTWEKYRYLPSEGMLFVPTTKGMRLILRWCHQFELICSSGKKSR